MLFFYMIYQCPAYVYLVMPWVKKGLIIECRRVIQVVFVNNGNKLLSEGGIDGTYD